MTQPYTDTDVELVAETVAQALALEAWQVRLASRSALRALAATGRLTPAGGETRTEYKYVLTYPDGTRKDRLVDSLAVARAVAASPANWLPPGPPGEVYVRDITTSAGPWLPAPEEDTDAT